MDNTGLLAIAKAIDRANALKAIELQIDYGSVNVDKLTKGFLSQILNDAVNQLKNEEIA